LNALTLFYKCIEDFRPSAPGIVTAVRGSPPAHRGGCHPWLPLFLPLWLIAES